MIDSVNVIVHFPIKLIFYMYIFSVAVSIENAHYYVDSMGSARHGATHDTLHIGVGIVVLIRLSIQ